MIGSAEFTGLIKLAMPELNQVIMANQGGKAPKKPYAVFKITSETSQGMPIKVDANSADNPTTKITETVQRIRNLNLEVNFYTAAESEILKKKPDCAYVARELCNMFLERLYLTSVQDFMKDNGFSLLDTRDFQDVGMYLGDKHERRAICELIMNYVDGQSDDIPFIEAQSDSEITGTYTDAAGTEL